MPNIGKIKKAKAVIDGRIPTLSLDCEVKFVPNENKMEQLKHQISEKDVETALHSVAQLVKRHGDKYWPIFVRLEHELENKRSKSKRLNQALNLNRA